MIICRRGSASIASSIGANGDFAGFLRDVSSGVLRTLRAIGRACVACDRSRACIARTTYLPRMSHSRFTASPARSVCRFVCAHVNGMIWTSNRWSSSARDGQADAVDGDRSLANDKARSVGGNSTVSQ